MATKFTPKSRLTDMAKNVLKKRYFQSGETKWKQVPRRVVDYICDDWSEEDRETMYDMIYHRYFIPNSPTLVNSGKQKHAGLSACFVVPFEDTIEEIYKTKYDFALVARKGGGCGTTLTNIRPVNELVNGSTHGYAGGPIKFANTISHDMNAITQSGFRQMAIMFTMSVYHPDILEFITSKTEEGKIANANISVVVDDAFMDAVRDDKEYIRTFTIKREDEEDEIVTREPIRAREVFDKIVEGAWRNGEPGLLFYDKINDREFSPYAQAGVMIEATNPCGEQPLPPYGSCNLGSLDLSKFVRNISRNEPVNWELLEIAVRKSVRFLDSIIDKNSFPSQDFLDVAIKARPIGLGIMGLADVYMKREIAYGSEEGLELLNKILAFIYIKAVEESEILGNEKGVPKWCRMLDFPRRNITVLSIAPTGTISLLAGCNSGIEPFFSEITHRKDKTGEYVMEAEESSKPYYRCAVPSYGDKWKEVTWEEHIMTQAIAQKWVDSGVSKTINFPQMTRRETIGKAFMKAWQEGCKGITVYRNGSRDLEVLTPKNVSQNKCPACGSDTYKYDGCRKCENCEWEMCLIG